MLSGDRIPRFDTVLKISKAPGLKLHAEAGLVPAPAKKQIKNLKNKLKRDDQCVDAENERQASDSDLIYSQRQGDFYIGYSTDLQHH